MMKLMLKLGQLNINEYHTNEESFGGFNMPENKADIKVDWEDTNKHEAEYICETERKFKETYQPRTDVEVGKKYSLLKEDNKVKVYKGIVKGLSVNNGKAFKEQNIFNLFNINIYCLRGGLYFT